MENLIQLANGITLNIYQLEDAKKELNKLVDMNVDLSTKNDLQAERIKELVQKLQHLINICPPIWQPVKQAQELINKIND